MSETHRFRIRHAEKGDVKSIHRLYTEVAAKGGGIAREADEITPDYVTTILEKSLKSGMCFILEDSESPEKVCAEIHCYKPEPRVFHHILSDLTVVVHPTVQGQGLGKKLFLHLLGHVQNERTDILRIELIARESNVRAIEFYKKIGFEIEGTMRRRIHSGSGRFESDIPMAWFNKNFV